MEDYIASYNSESIVIMNEIFCDPENWEMWYNLACFYRLWGNGEAAKQYFEYALNLDPANDDIHAELLLLAD